MVKHTDIEVKSFKTFIDKIKEFKNLEFDIDYDAITVYEFFKSGEQRRALNTLDSMDYKFRHNK